MDVENLLIVDLNSVPEGLNIDVWLTLIQENHVLLYDGRTKDGYMPDKPEDRSGKFRIVNLAELSKDEREELCKLLNIEL